MSAFICSDDHFRALANYACASAPKCNFPRVSIDYLGLDPQQRADYNNSPANGSAREWMADTLYRENVRSVRHRYPQEDFYAPESLGLDLGPSVTDPVHILKMCACLSYQSCETDDWEQTAACKIIKTIERAAIAELPGWDSAPWAYEVAA